MPECDHLLIDGYNLIHTEPDWKRWLKSDSMRSRRLLSDWVRSIHDVDGVRTSVVFDGRGSDTTVEYPYNDRTFTYIFSPSGLTADSVIEHMVGKSTSPDRLCIGSDDRILQHTVLALGAQVFSKNELGSWVASCERRLRRMIDYS